jgi:hypothetical protein
MGRPAQSPTCASPPSVRRSTPALPPPTPAGRRPSDAVRPATPPSTSPGTAPCPLLPPPGTVRRPRPVEAPCSFWRRMGRRADIEARDGTHSAAFASRGVSARGRRGSRRRATGRPFPTSRSAGNSPPRFPTGVLATQLRRRADVPRARSPRSARNARRRRMGASTGVRAQRGRSPSQPPHRRGGVPRATALILPEPSSARYRCNGGRCRRRTGSASSMARPLDRAPMPNGCVPAAVQ